MQRENKILKEIDNLGNRNFKKKEDKIFDIVNKNKNYL